MVFKKVALALLILGPFPFASLNGEDFKLSVTPNKINPIKGEQACLNYRVTEKSSYKISICRETGLKVREFTFNAVEPGNCTITWDGKNGCGEVVPQGIYFIEVYKMTKEKPTTPIPTKETLEKEGKYIEDLNNNLVDVQGNQWIKVYSELDNPVGPILPKGINIDKKTKTISYTLDKDAKVRIRAGISNGPMMDIIHDWQAEGKGEHKVKWNGFDTSNTYDIMNDKRMTIVISAIELPENYIYVSQSPSSLSAYNTKCGKIFYEKLPYDKRRIVRGSDIEASLAMQPDSANNIGQAPTMFDIAKMHLEHNPLYCKEANIQVDIIDGYGEDKNGSYIIDKDTEFVVYLGTDSKWVENDRYKIEIYIDGVFLNGEFKGYVPYRFKPDIAGLNKGRHLLTINLRSFQDHMGVVNLPIEIKD